MKVTKVERLRWPGQLFRMQEQNPCRKLTPEKSEGTRGVGTLAVRCMDSDEEDLKTTGARNWRWKSQDRGQCRVIVKKKGQGLSWTVTAVEKKKIFSSIFNLFF
jgi:hypothetical protein